MNTNTGTDADLVEIPELVLRLMEQSSRDLAHTTNTLLAGYQETAERCAAELAAVRDAVQSLLSGPWMPTPDAIRAALWPTPERVAKFRTSPTT